MHFNQLTPPHGELPDLAQRHFDPDLNAPDIYVLRRKGLPAINALTLAQLIAYLHTQPLCIYSIEVIRGDLRSLLVAPTETVEAKRWIEGKMTEVKPDPITGELRPVPEGNVVHVKFGNEPN